MRILFLGNYDPAYGRNRVIIKGMMENGVEVVVCNGGITGGVFKFLRLARRYFKVAGGHFDLAIVAFPAQEAIFMARLLLLFKRLRSRIPIVVDMLTSHYEGYILDRKKYSPQSFHAKWYKWIDRTAMKLADVSIVDSYSARRFLAQEMGMPIHNIITVFIGTDDSILKPMENETSNKFVVHFHGNFIPLQGPSYIVEAAHLLKENNDITFQIIGKGQEYSVCRTMADKFGLRNITWIDRIPYEDLPRYINRGDICLGTFGGTGKFNRCAPNKVYEYMACGKAILTGRSDALEKLAEDGKNMILCNPADGRDLADKIVMLKKNPELRKALGIRAREDFLRLYTPKQLMKKLVNDLYEVGLLKNEKRYS